MTQWFMTKMCKNGSSRYPRGLWRLPPTVCSPDLCWKRLIFSGRGLLGSLICLESPSGGLTWANLNILYWSENSVGLTGPQGCSCSAGQFGPHGSMLELTMWWGSDPSAGTLGGRLVLGWGSGLGTQLGPSQDRRGPQLHHTTRNTLLSIEVDSSVWGTVTYGTAAGRVSY